MKNLFFFWTGIIATFAYRIIIVLNFFDPLWVKIAWYIGTVGFIVYFYHEFQAERRETRLAKENNLLELVDQVEGEGERKEALKNLVKSATASKSHLNAAFIFGLSVLALITGIILDCIQFCS